jgi:hypothetical protein
MYEIVKSEQTGGYILVKTVDGQDEVVGVFSKKEIAEQEKYRREFPERILF